MPIENNIMEILKWRRRAGSKTLDQFIKHYMSHWQLSVDPYGNMYTRIGTAPVMWSCHLDTVHRKEGWQNVKISGTGIITQKGKKSRCLGADDGAGIWLLLEMINKGIEGLYIFHQDEEIGGKGSKWIVENTPELVKDIKYAIAFDRKATTSVITSQWGVCCSDTFGTSLALGLGMAHELDDTGRFTDTDNYKSLIPECTNVSAGYYSEHTPCESLDYLYLVDLRDALFNLEVDKLVVERECTKPYVYKPRHIKTTSWNQVDTSRYYDNNTDDYWTKRNAEHAKKIIADANEAIKAKQVDEIIITPGTAKHIMNPRDVRATNIENVERVCSLNARKMARLFMDMGATYDDVLQGFLSLDLSRINTARHDVNNGDGWLSMIATFVLGRNK
jgi:hypothetical protein